MYLSITTCSSNGCVLRKSKLTYGEDYTIINLASGRPGLRLLKRVTLFTNGDSLHFEKHHVWNGASIPRAFWWFIGKPTDPKFVVASLYHDRMYELRLDRDKADTVFRKLLDKSGVNGRRVALMWAAVRVFGHTFYAATADNNKVSTKLWRVVLKLM